MFKYLVFSTIPNAFSLILSHSFSPKLLLCQWTLPNLFWTILIMSINYSEPFSAILTNSFSPKILWHLLPIPNPLWTILTHAHPFILNQSFMMSINHSEPILTYSHPCLAINTHLFSPPTLIVSTIHYELILNHFHQFSPFHSHPSSNDVY